MLRAEDIASMRRNELNKVNGMIEALGSRLGYSMTKQGRVFLWEESGQIIYAFSVLASALVERAISEAPFRSEKMIVVLPGGRALACRVQGPARSVPGCSLEGGSGDEIPPVADSARGPGADAGIVWEADRQ